jgi:addiction module RelB/DinJ family antitoxin
LQANLLWVAFLLAKMTYEAKNLDIACYVLAICKRLDYNILKEAIYMAKTASVFTRVEPEIKMQAEQVLDKLGISMSNAVDMFLRQVIIQRGIPFEMKLPQEKPLAYGSLTKEQFDAEIEKGLDDIKNGRVYSLDEVEAEMKRDFGI